MALRVLVRVVLFYLRTHPTTHTLLCRFCHRYRYSGCVAELTPSTSTGAGGWMQKQGEVWGGWDEHRLLLHGGREMGDVSQPQ